MSMKMEKLMFLRKVYHVLTKGDNNFGDDRLLYAQGQMWVATASYHGESCWFFMQVFAICWLGDYYYDRTADHQVYSNRSSGTASNNFKRVASINHITVRL
nr:signal peptidase complex catalytic subunit SEC11A-like [Tanacetum cinerariifolium]